MATKEQAEWLARELSGSYRSAFFKNFDGAGAGIGFALKLLYVAESNRLSAGALSEAMGVSTARVAVLLKKMEGRGLIVKKHDRSDARVTVVCLSEAGRLAAEQTETTVLHCMSNLIDRIGMEKLQQFIALSAEVNAAMDAELSERTERLR